MGLVAHDIYDECDGCKEQPLSGVLFPIGLSGEPARVQECPVCNDFEFTSVVADRIAELLDSRFQPRETTNGMIFVDCSGAPLMVDEAKWLLSQVHPDESPDSTD